MFKSYYLAYLDSLTSDSSGEVDMTQVNCFTPQYWFAIVTVVSSLTMTLNASIGVFIYCVMCKNFRAELLRHLRQGRSFVARLMFALKSETSSSRFEMVAASTIEPVTV